MSRIRGTGWAIALGMLGGFVLLLSLAIRADASRAWEIGSYIMTGAGFLLLFAAWPIYKRH